LAQQDEEDAAAEHEAEEADVVATIAAVAAALTNAIADNVPGLSSTPHSPLVVEGEEEQLLGQGKHKPW